MTHTLTIARREIEERAFVLVAAIAAALVPFVVLAVPHTTGADRAGAIAAIGFLVAVGFTWGLALVLGVTLIGRELSERRLSFYFSRPVSGAAIWFGKLIGATAVLVASFLIVHAIPLTLGGGEWKTMATETRSVVASGVLAIGFALMLIAHIVSTWARSHSPLLALDFAGVLTFIAVATASIVALAFAGARSAAFEIAAVLLIALVVAVLGGGAWQLARGRVDARRSHRALSTFVWTTLGIAVVVAGAWTAWVLGASPRNLTTAFGGFQQGNIVRVEGVARGTESRFAICLTNGAYVRETGYFGTAAGDVSVSVTPTRTAHNAVDALFSNFFRADEVVVTVRRMVPQPHVIAEVTVPWFPDGLGISSDGRTLVYVSQGALVVMDTETKKSTAARLPFAWRGGKLETAILSDGAVRVGIPEWRDDGWILHVVDFNPIARKWSEPMPAPRVPSGTAYLLRNNRLVTSLGRGWTWEMRDGRTAISQRQGIEIRRGETVERTITTPGSRGGTVMAEIGSGRLLVSGETPDHQRGTYFVDANTGAVSAPMVGVSPVIESPFVGSTATQPRFHALVRRAGGRIEVIDTQTGALRPLM